MCASRTCQFGYRMMMVRRTRGLAEGFASDATAFEPGRPPVDLVEPQAHGGECALGWMA
jgi:hypothetical protein